ncbi:uncharacterized protein LOC120627535 [Pararge aegeria]|uniref:uncharacterized protein LOC120627535 n=1 Tax=Pararge aegeria TaxID=116150 RepID=UPI0019D0E664|nr:uncharacterized protein LOC120627535 [Pararge aegeria]
MPKRKKDRSDDCDFDYLAKKLRNIERKISRKRGRRTLSSDSDNMSLQDPNSSEPIAAIEVDVTEPQECCSYWNEPLEQSNGNTHHSDVTDTVATAAAPVASASPQLQRPNDPVTANELIVALPDAQTEPTLNPELLSILGEDPTTVKEYGDNIQKDLAVRLSHISSYYWVKQRKPKRAKR